MSQYINKNLYVGDTGKTLGEISKIPAVNTSSSTSTTDTYSCNYINSAISTASKVPCAGAYSTDKNYSVSSWSRPAIIVDNFTTNDSSVFSKVSNYGIKVLKEGYYLITFSRESSCSTSEQDCYLSWGSGYKGFPSYSAMLTVSVCAYLYSGNIIYGDINTGYTSFNIRHASLSVIKVS